MPKYMDRHDVPGATSQDVADAHVKDLEVSAKHDVEFFSYWFDPKEGVAFCFADAPSKENMEGVHQESHGLSPSEIIEVSEDNVLRFFGKVQHPVDHTEVTSPFRTIMFTDLEGSTKLLESLGVRGFMALLTEHDLITRRSLVAWRGREVKHTGDGFLASFLDVTDGLRLRVRIGLDAGEPVDRNDDLFGTVVNMASRICDAAPPGGALVSEVVQRLGEANGFSFGKRTPTVLKGFSEPTPLFEMHSPPVEPV